MKSLWSRKLALCLFPTQWRGTSDLFWLVFPHDMTELLFIKIPGSTPREFWHCKDAVLDGYNVRPDFCGECSRLSTSQSGWILWEMATFSSTGCCKLCDLTVERFMLALESSGFSLNLPIGFLSYGYFSLIPSLVSYAHPSFPLSFLIKVCVPYIHVSYLKLFVEYGGRNRQTNTISTAINKNIWNQETQVFWVWITSWRNG